MQPPITHERTDHDGAFIMARDGKRLAEMTYTLSGSQLTIRHTEVDDALRGTGAGKKLLEALVQWARKDKLKVASHCSFSSAMFEKTPAAYADVLAS